MKKYTKDTGYVEVKVPNHPACRKGYVYEHRYIMEQYLGRYLSGTEIIHHVNGIRNDNRLENLMLLKDQKEHRRIHAGWIKKDGKWSKTCRGCNEILEVNKENFNFRKTGKPVHLCKKCAYKIQREYLTRNQEKVRARRKAYSEKNKVELALKRKQWVKDNPEKHKLRLEKRKLYREKNAEKLRLYRVEYKRRKADEAKKGKGL